jgi:hypothetical protein
MKQTGDELRAALQELGLDVPKDAVEGLVKSYGEPAAEGDFDYAEIEAIAEAMRKAMEAPPKLEELDDDAFDLDDDDEYIDVAASLERFAKGADVLATRHEVQAAHVAQQLEVLQKAWLAEMELNERLAKSHDELLGLVKGQGEQLQAIAQQLGTPIPPRSVTGDVEPEPSPGEKLQKGPRPGELFDEVLQKAHSVIQDAATPEQRRLELLSAVGQLEAGIDPAQVAKDHSIALGA